MDMISRDQYRAWGAECRGRAQDARDFKSKYEWIKLAQSWERLADGSVSRAIPRETDKLQA